MKQREVPSTEVLPPSASVLWTRRAGRALCMVVMSIAVFFAAREVWFFYHLLQTPQKNLDRSQKKPDDLPAFIDSQSLMDPEGVWLFANDLSEPDWAKLSPLLPLPKESEPICFRLDKRQIPVYQAFQVSTSAEQLIRDWQSEGWSVREEKTQNSATFQVQCSKLNQIVLVWSSDPPDRIETLMFFKGQ